MPASVGPTRLTPGAIEWQAAQPGGVALNSARPSSTGFWDAACGGAAPTTAPGTALPRTRIGRGRPPLGVDPAHPGQERDDVVDLLLAQLEGRHQTGVPRLRVE